MKRALGLDYGEARIGVAIADDLGMLAHPLQTLDARAQPLPEILRIVAERKIEVIILGLPRKLDGTDGPAAIHVRAFAETLRAAAPCPVKLWDERLTTAAAQKSLHATGRNVKNSRPIIDQVAAQLILQGYLDSQAMLG